MKILIIGRTYLNKKEKPNNSGFEDNAFEVEMVNEGWQKGWAWCAIFTKLLAKKAYPEKADEFNKLFTPGAVATFNNFKKAGYKISTKPVLGALVIWQKYVEGKPDWRGHAGICSEVINDTTFKAIEGNTSFVGSRNGDRVWEHTRTTEKNNNGLNVLGFVLL